MEKQQQELMIRLQLFDQQAQQLQQQYQAVEQATIEMGQLNFGLDDLKNSKDKEIMAAFGRGIFVKAKIIDEDLVVDVGGKNFVKKDIESTKKLIQEQIKKLQEIKQEIENSLQILGEEMTKMIEKSQETSNEK